MLQTKLKLARSFNFGVEPLFNNILRFLLALHILEPIFSDCKSVTVVSGDKYDGRFIVENLLTQDASELPEKLDSTTKTNYWVAPNGKAASFVLNLGCPKSFKDVKLVNIHNRSYKDRSTKQFK